LWREWRRLALVQARVSHPVRVALGASPSAAPHPVRCLTIAKHPCPCLSQMYGDDVDVISGLRSSLGAGTGGGSAAHNSPRRPSGMPFSSPQRQASPPASSARAGAALPSPRSPAGARTSPDKPTVPGRRLSVRMSRRDDTGSWREDRGGVAAAAAAPPSNAMVWLSAASPAAAPAGSPATVPSPLLGPSAPPSLGGGSGAMGGSARLGQAQGLPLLMLHGQSQSHRVEVIPSGCHTQRPSSSTHQPTRPLASLSYRCKMSSLLCIVVLPAYFPSCR
jgi:hypothetical protein